MKRDGMSIVETVIALLVLAVAILPMLGLLSSSSTTSRGSMHELLARQYASELAEQLLALQTMPGWRRIARGEDLKAWFQRADLDRRISDRTLPQPTAVGLPGTAVFLVVSPLVPPFTDRRIAVEPVPLQAGAAAEWFRVTITVGWGGPGSGMGDNVRHQREFCLFLQG